MYGFLFGCTGVLVEVYGFLCTSRKIPCVDGGYGYREVVTRVGFIVRVPARVRFVQFVRGATELHTSK
jgi:hypothetical protein